MEHIQGDFALLAEGVEDLEVERVGGGEPVDGEPVGQVEWDDAAADGVQAGGQQLRQRGDVNLSPDEPPTSRPSPLRRL